jgi:hypothetical protein
VALESFAVGTVVAHRMNRKTVAKNGAQGQKGNS